MAKEKDTNTWDEAPEVVEVKLENSGDTITGRYLGSRVVPTRYGPRNVHTLDVDGIEHELFVGVAGDRKLRRVQLGRLTRIVRGDEVRRPGSKNATVQYSVAQAGPRSRVGVIGRERMPTAPRADDFGDDIDF